jgi:hypothetical protein
VGAGAVACSDRAGPVPGAGKVDAVCPRTRRPVVPRVRSPRLRSWLPAAIVAAVLVLMGPAPALAQPGVTASPWTGELTRTSSSDRYVRPVPGEGVLRGFDPGLTPYGAGHRGVDLPAAAGAMVHAAADGTVRHAGPVAGTVWVSIDHADGVTTSYGPLTALEVRRGAAVSVGDVLGRLAAGGHGRGQEDRGLHWGARRGLVYLDPLSLLEPAPWRPSLVGPGGWRGDGHAVRAYTGWEGARWRGIGVAPSPVAARPGFAVPPNGNHLVLVRGLGSSSEGSPFDPDHLGYDPRSVTAHSYAGIDPATEAGDPDDPWRAQRPYGPEDTWRGVEAASAHLRDQLRARWAEEPGRAVDLVGYSMGGVVVMHYLTRHHDAYDPTLPPIGHVATLASPLQGSDVAALGAEVRDHGALAPALRRLHERGRLGGLPPPDAVALEDLRPGSDVLRSLDAGWVRALEADAAGALAMGTRVLTVAGSRDQVVGAHRAPLPGGADSHGRHEPTYLHRVLPGGHGTVLETEALREVLWRFLAGEEVVESPGHLATMVSREQGDALRIAGGLLRLHGRVFTP